MNKKCKVENCDLSYFHKGYCKPHFLQFQNFGKIVKQKIRIKKKCSIKGCDREHFAKGYCCTHYWQYKKHGRIIKKYIHSRNNILLKDTYALIELYDKYGKVISCAIIDLDDVEKCQKQRWCTDKHLYVGSHKVGMLHNFILGKPIKGLEIDHINHNSLDNRKCNLRIVTHTKNMQNLSLRIDNTSGHAGVGFYRGKWCAWITVNKKDVELGKFIHKRNAIKAREKAEKKYFKI